MLTRDYVEREIVHIQRMIAMLENDADAGEVVMAGAVRVSRPSYWRRRLEELMAMPDMPGHVRRMGEALLAKVDGMESRLVDVK
ncbi:hypothetical protein NUV26_02435 [Burkholderia pseudomultivorans]|uniref:hypothetical protein n=1 Tax=Burkholderia pseudomultivorans TaxID=1207504 RepID=UPI000758AD0C|nr:hypothetical protein [Burkholderia pseudomultivorans]KVC25059.1 hypothetical protein WS56_29160 [Burkholderia pseudomultivorans]KVC34878.1 hypothetical protein WS55_32950 [Burkholderia pseudomultivorans]KVC38263.1 hypothetical protein WS58_23505 [Burkholderia pseudomultivorans]KWI47304.1 hypothetical protein WT72_30755 [Burkholderia pseudomultivorans]MBF5010885.1 hypothetical protein [Burkholderia pseudomultivorans]